MTSEVEICRLGLSHLRAGTIDSLDDAGTEAQACKLWYAQSRDLALADFPWNFAGKTAALAKQVEEPNEWSFGYAYPSDALKARYVTPPGKLRQHTDRIPFEVAINDVGNKSILTNLDEACLTYTFKLVDPNLFDQHFIIALSWQIAVNVAIPIVGSAKGRVLKEDALAGYATAIRAAYSANSAECYPGKSRESETTEAYGEAGTPETRLLS